MANPLDAFKDLKPWQQGAVVVGSLGVVGLVVYQRQKAKKAPAIPGGTPAAAAASGVASTAGDVQDPTTGQQYPIDAIDPDSGLPYGQEIAEYGSVSAADATAGAGYQAASQGITPQEYVEQTGGTGNGATSGSTVTTNAQWMAEVETGLSEQNYTASDIGQGLAAYFASKPLGTSSDGTNLYTMMNLAISEYGPPPTGSYPLLIAGSTTPPPPKPVPKPAAKEVTIPNVAGHTAEEATSTLEAIDLHPVNPKGTPGTSVVTSTTPAAGAKVAAKSTVEIHSKAPKINGRPAAKQ